jgi:hypothetical protein
MFTPDIDRIIKEHYEQKETVKPAEPIPSGEKKFRKRIVNKYRYQKVEYTPKNSLK